MIDGCMSGERRPHAGPFLNLLHYWWPIAIGWSLALVDGASRGQPVSPAGMGVLLWGICGAYSLDRIADPGFRSGPEEPRWLRRLLGGASIVSGVACLALARHLPPGTAALVPVLAIAGLTYRQLKRHPLTKAFIVPAVWVWAGIALPIADGSWLGWRSVCRPITLPLFALVAAGCLLCDIKDAESDRASGVGSMPARHGVSGTVWSATVLAIVGAGLALAQHRLGLVAAAAALTALAQGTSILASGPLGALLVDVALTLPGLLILIRRSP
jgi:4-hydroxybenzoate polyprenyltransferase